MAMRAGLNLEQTPLLVTWELPGDSLPAEAATALIREIAALGAPVLELVGGSLWQQPRLLAIIAAARQQGLQVWAAGGPLAAVGPTTLAAARQAGLSRVGFPLEPYSPNGGPAPAAAAQCIRWAAAAELLVQAETTAWAPNAKSLPAMLELAASSGATVWSLAIPVPHMPRERRDLLAPEEYEEILRWLAQVAAGAPLLIKAANAPMFRRVLLQQLPPGAMLRKRKALLPTNDGRGTLHVTARGEIQPSRWLPLHAGRVGQAALTGVYRSSRLFVRLRRPALLQGRCGRCAWRALCGGSRARAYAMTGNCLAADPLCAGTGRPR